ncbi:alpha/beta fold hydrolase [Streptomyces sp. NPDC056464]|uniref:alpha/beta fold hydrolase n=1 Tax=Streptomyces sp. NPDC056464 TaxID=3345828 RepID=UPI003676E06D
MPSLAATVLTGATITTRVRGRLRKRTAVTADGYVFHYYEGGSGETLVLLHGLADDKNSFLAAAARLTGRYRVILPDLPGHGENEQDPRRDYSIRGHVAALESLVSELGLDRFHLGGNSMGGHVSGAYTLRHPERVLSLMLVNAPGLQLDDRLIYVGFGARMKTREDFDAVLDRMYYRKPKLPGFVVRHMLHELDSRFDHVNAMTRAVVAGEDYDISERIGKIHQPTLVLWGRHDVVVPFAVAEAYEARIPNARLQVLEGAGHVPQLEIAEQVAESIANFLAPAEVPA